MLNLINLPTILMIPNHRVFEIYNREYATKKKETNQCMITFWMNMIYFIFLRSTDMCLHTNFWVRFTLTRWLFVFQGSEIYGTYVEGTWRSPYNRSKFHQMTSALFMQISNSKIMKYLYHIWRSWFTPFWVS